MRNFNSQTRSFIKAAVYIVFIFASLSIYFFSGAPQVGVIFPIAAWTVAMVKHHGFKSENSIFYSVFSISVLLGVVIALFGYDPLLPALLTTSALFLYGAFGFLGNMALKAFKSAQRRKK